MVNFYYLLKELEELLALNMSYPWMLKIFQDQVALILENSGIEFIFIFIIK